MNTKKEFPIFLRLILLVCVLTLPACSDSIRVSPQAAVYKGHPTLFLTVRSRSVEVRYPPQAAVYKGRPIVMTTGSRRASIPAPAWVAIIKSRQ